jgi:hypothetical protein
MTVITRPSMTDDSGVLTDGTIVDKAFMDDIMDEVDDQCHSATNPTIKPKAITDEVVTARGSMGSLDTRLDVSLEEDGTLKTQASLVSQTQAAELPQTNVILNDTFIIWDAGDAAAPTGWTLAGAGAAVARAGTGLGDTKRKVGDFCAKVTYGSATAQLYQQPLPAAAYSRLDHLDGETVGFGAWVWASAASQSRIYCSDGASLTYSSYHTGGSAWEWLSGTHTLAGAATHIGIGINVESGAANPAYLSGFTVIFGSIAPANWRPTPSIYGTIVHPVAGDVSVDTEIGNHIFQRMGIVKDTQLYAETGPVGADLIVDVNGGDGTNSMYSTLPEIADGAEAGSAAPDGTYQYRCFKGYTGATVTGAILRTEVTQTGVGTVGANLTIMVRVMVYVDPFESVKVA